jgi:hypothetical protein
LPEVAAVTVVYTLVVELGLARVIPGWGPRLDPRALWATSREAMTMVGAIFIIIFASTTLTQFMVDAEVPTKMVEWTSSHVESKVVFLLAINVILLIVGTVMDIFSAIVVVVPLIAPIAEHYGVDPYHLGVIFLLNLEVGYLHPPVGLNLFITSVKFHRPITEVMWATIPFLVTMIVALLTITYVPQLTAWSTPEAERTGRVQDLAASIHTAVEELGVVKDVALVDAAGTPLADAKGVPIVKHIKDCDDIADESAKGGCQQLFFDVKACKGDRTCANKAIAEWTAKNNSSDDPNAIVLVAEVPLVTSDGAPVKDKKTGAPIVRKRGDCVEGSRGDACRELFVKVSNCKISPPPDGADACIKSAVGAWVDENMQGDAP